MRTPTKFLISITQPPNRVVFYLVINQLPIQTSIQGKLSGDLFKKKHKKIWKIIRRLKICVADASTYSTGTEMKILSQNINKKRLNNFVGNQNKCIFVFNKNLNHEQRTSIRSSK